MEVDGSLYVEMSGVWEEMYCVIKDRHFQSFEKLRQNLPATRSNATNSAVVEFKLQASECECKPYSLGLAALSRLKKTSHLHETPFFFSITLIAEDHVYQLAACTEADRTRWLDAVKALAIPKQRTASAWVNTGFMKQSNDQSTNRFAQSSGNGEKIPRLKKSKSNISTVTRTNANAKDELDNDDDATEYSDANNQGKAQSHNAKQLSEHLEGGDEDYDDKVQCGWFQCHERVLGIKIDTMIRLVKVCLAFPFVIVTAALNFSSSSKFAMLRSVSVIQSMNIFIYVVPVVLIQFVLSQYPYPNIQRISIALYILMYLLPVGYVAFSKLQVASSTHKIEEGTFCFKPARSVRWSQGNFWCLVGFFFEWMQHTLYVIPTGILRSGTTATRLSSFPPYLPFKYYFWISVASSFACGLIIVLNSVLRGKLHYKFQKSYTVWFFLYNVGSPMYVTIVTILFMGLWCDYSVTPATLIQDPSIVCYSSEHTVMAQAGLMALAIYLVQNTLLPSGTFKETMRDDELDIMFVPVYLQSHFLFKAIFCGIYVFYYNDNIVRVIALTLINLILLCLNNFMKPCSVEWINVLRDTFFVHASLSGIQSLNYLAWPINLSTKSMVLSTLASNIVFASIGMYIYYTYTSKSTEYSIARSFLDLEWQVSRGGSVHPRVLEPLISLTLSKVPADLDIAKKYIGQLVWLISYPNMRVQFQSAWGLANLALVDDAARLEIHNADGTKTLFEWYTDMDFVVQLEALAAMANLTLCEQVANDMVTRHKCIPFFITLVASNKLKHSQFAAIALGNLARKESNRNAIRRLGGIQTLVGCIMSHDYFKRRYGCLALANMAMSPAEEIEQVFESKGLIDRILKMAKRKEIETQREVMALIRNLSCHARLRPLLLDRGVMLIVKLSRDSVYKEVREWCDEVTELMEKEISSLSVDLKALGRREGMKGSAVGVADVDLLQKMEPLKGMVEWSTWGSKLESIFSPIFSTVPSLQGVQVATYIDEPLTIYLAKNLSKSMLKSWRDNMSFIVVEKPAHGKLSEYTTNTDYVTYTPNAGYHGSDFFTFRLQLGSSTTWPATVAISIDDEVHNGGDVEMNMTGVRHSAEGISSPMSASRDSVHDSDTDQHSNHDEKIEQDGPVNGHRAPTIARQWTNPPGTQFSGLRTNSQSADRKSTGN